MAEEPAEWQGYNRWVSFQSNIVILGPRAQPLLHPEESLQVARDRTVGNPGDSGLCPVPVLNHSHICRLEDPTWPFPPLEFVSGTQDGQEVSRPWVGFVDTQHFCISP